MIRQKETLSAVLRLVRRSRNCLKHGHVLNAALLNPILSRYKKNKVGYMSVNHISYLIIMNKVSIQISHRLSKVPQRSLNKSDLLRKNVKKLDI
jgi:hypothetical protein